MPEKNRYGGEPRLISPNKPRIIQSHAKHKRTKYFQHKGAHEEAIGPETPAVHYFGTPDFRKDFSCKPPPRL